MAGFVCSVRKFKNRAQFWNTQNRIPILLYVSNFFDNWKESTEFPGSVTYIVVSPIHLPVRLKNVHNWTTYSFNKLGF